MLDEELERFEAFGAILDAKTRKYLARYLRAKLRGDEDFPEELNSAYYAYFSRALDRLFAGTLLTDLCRSSESLGARVARDTLAWMRKAFAESAAHNPYAGEFERFGALAVTPLTRFRTSWHYITNFLTSTYGREELDAHFYETRFSELSKYSGNDETWERLLTDLLSQWDALLQAKYLLYRLQKLEEQEQPFAERMQQQAADFARLQSLLSPFAQYAGRYWDMGQDLWQHTSFDVLQQYDALLQQEDSVRELADLLGRMREAEIETEEEQYEEVIVRRSRVQDPWLRSEVDGIHASGDLHAMLPSEVALMADPATEAVFLQRFADRQLLTLRYQDQRMVTGTEEVSASRQQTRQKQRGPFILCVDTSDSMKGTPEHIAKVLCFAILKMAARENRSAYLINFSTGIKTLDLLDIGRSLDALADFLTMSFHGGTDITLAWHEVMRVLRTEQYRDADVLVISDFIMYRVDEDLLRQVRAQQQQAETRFHSLTLSTDPNARIRQTFDTNWLYNPYEKGIIRELVREVGALAG